MQRILDLRIVRWYFKLLYVLGAYVVPIPVIALLKALSVPALIVSLVSTALLLASILLGARIFLGRGEPVESPRLWWQMTARPLLSRMIAIIALLGVISFVALFAEAALGLARAVQSLQRSTVAEAVIDAILTAIVAFLYLNSAVRLTKVPAPAREPKFKPTVKLN